MSLVGAGVVTVRIGYSFPLTSCSRFLQHEFHNLEWCRHLSKQCRILEAIKAFSWIFWAWTIFLFMASVLNMVRNHADYTGSVHGRRDTAGSYPPESRYVTQQPTTYRNPSGIAPDVGHQQYPQQQQQYDIE
jgi:hypothetical protein